MPVRKPLITALDSKRVSVPSFRRPRARATRPAYSVRVIKSETYFSPE
jgi:hypothetical protein